MTTIQAFISQHVLQYSDLLIELHRLIASGKCDEDEADAVRDQMDIPWRLLTPDEIEIVGDLSVALYDLHGQVRSGVDFSPEIADQIQCRLGAKDWFGALSALRIHSSELPSVALWFFYGACWANLGQPNVAAEFFEGVNKLLPSSAAVQLSLLSTFLRAKRYDEAIELGSRLAAASTDPPTLLKAGEAFFAAAEARTPIDRELLKRGIAAVRDSKKLISQGSIDENLRNQLVSGLLQSSMASFQLGDLSEAKTASEEALRWNPNSLDVYMMLGILDHDLSARFAGPTVGGILSQRLISDELSITTNLATL